MKKIKTWFLKAASRGFSLIEVNMAILVVAGGLLTLFALFPSGLRMSVSSISDTRQALLADAILARIQGNATLVPDLNTWIGTGGHTVKELWDDYLDPFPGLCDGYSYSSTGISTSLPADASDDDDFGASESDRYYVTGQIEGFFVRTGNSIKDVPARFCVRLMRGNLSNAERGVNDNTWHVAVAVSDIPDTWYYDNSVYCAELRPSF